MANETTARNWLIQSGRQFAESLTGASLQWPLDGTAYPCSCTPLTNSSKLQTDGVSLFDDCVATLRLTHFPSTRPAENQACRIMVGPLEQWRTMKIDSVVVPPGSGTIQLVLNSYSEGA